MSGVLLAGGTNNILFWGVYIVFFGALIYFMAYRPQQKQKKQQEELFASIAIGDSVLTTAGFYGIIIDMTDDTVIVEFGNNKNCRIPMQKSAIVQVEKPGENGRGTKRASAQCRRSFAISRIRTGSESSPAVTGWRSRRQ